jgi:hypothetical protein
MRIRQLNERAAIQMIQLRPYLFVEGGLESSLWSVDQAIELNGKWQIIMSVAAEGDPSSPVLCQRPSHPRLGRLSMSISGNLKARKGCRRCRSENSFRCRSKGCLQNPNWAEKKQCSSFYYFIEPTRTYLPELYSA